MNNMQEYGLERALRASKEFGAEAVANNTQFSSDDRLDMAHYYGVDTWADIPVEHRNMLIDAFREGERIERTHRNNF